MCRIGWMEEAPGRPLMLQRCLIRGHWTFSEWLWEQVRSSPSDSPETVALWGSLSQLTVAGDVSTTVTLSR
jgi:hypothetical protein